MEAATLNYDSLEEDRRIDLAKSLLQHLEEKDEGNVLKVLTQLTEEHESSLFREIGKLTRQLHDALGSYEHDERITSLAKNDIPNAKERLNYVINKTEESAHRTLDIIEKLLPVSESLEEASRTMHGDWQRFVRREMDVDEFRKLSTRLDSFLNQVCDDTGRIKQDMSELMLAQDYQDITGQVIRQVISLVQEVESQLVKVIRNAGHDVPAKLQEGKDIVAEGPQINKDSPNVMSDQDEVDELLSSLGF